MLSKTVKFTVPYCRPLLILNILLANVSPHAVIRDLPEIIPQMNLIKCLGKFFFY